MDAEYFAPGVAARLALARGLGLDQDAKVHARRRGAGLVGDGRVGTGAGGQLQKQAGAAIAFVQLARRVEKARADAQGGGQAGAGEECAAQRGEVLRDVGGRVDIDL